LRVAVANAAARFISATLGEPTETEAREAVREIRSVLRLPLMLQQSCGTRKDESALPV
jgi:hypothetical protein